MEGVWDGLSEVGFLDGVREGVEVDGESVGNAEGLSVTGALVGVAVENVVVMQRRHIFRTIMHGT